MQRLHTIFLSFFKIGLFTFGGGYAMLPLIERELIAKRKWIEQKEFLDLLTLAQSVPGPIAVNTSVFVGYKVRGFGGAVAALLGAVLPSFVIILAIALFFADIRQNPVVDAAFKGMRRLSWPSSSVRSSRWPGACTGRCSGSSPWRPSQSGEWDCRRSGCSSSPPCWASHGNSQSLKEKESNDTLATLHIIP